MGCGKTGLFLSSDHLVPSPITESETGNDRSNLKPDLLTLGKSITGGVYPATYVLGRRECMDLVSTKEIMSTYSFSPVAVAVTIAALQVIDKEGLVAKARFIERVFLDVTMSWQDETDKDNTEVEKVGTYYWKSVRYVTAVGAELGIWLKENVDGEQGTVRAICAVCLREGLLVFPNYRRIRMSVAMVISEEDLRKGLSILKGALDEVLQNNKN